MFTTSDTTETTDGNTTFPILLSALKYTCEIAINTSETERTRKYNLPISIVSGLSVNKRIIVPGNAMDAKVKISAMVIPILAAMPIIFSTAFLSSLPQYWAHITDVAVAIP